MDTTIFVMTHKAFDPPEDQMYVPLHVGRAGKQDLGYLGDDTGDHISDLNEFFGELTGFYWIWKNYQGQENIGINHYRRYFRGKKQPLLSAEECAEILSEYDIIATNRSVGEKNHWEAYAEVHNVEDMHAVERAIHALSPDYDAAFAAVMAGTENYYANLCVMPRPLFDAYCEWLFSIFTEASKEIDVTGYDNYRRRVYGFLSEPLLMVFAVKNGLSVYENHVIYTQEKAETLELKAAVGMLIKEEKITEARKLFYDMLRVRPDVALALSDIRGELPLLKKLLDLITAEQAAGENRILERSHDLAELLRLCKEGEIG